MFYISIGMIKNILKFAMFFLFCWMVYGFTIPNYEWYVTDTVWVFSETQTSDLTKIIEEIEKITGIEVAVLVVPTVDDDINLAAVDVGNTRGVGKKGQDNGLILLIAIHDRKWSIQVGYGLEWTLPDLITKRIGEARFPPNFSMWNYYQGVVEMLDDVLWYIQKDPTILENYSNNTSSTFQDENFMEFFFIVFFIVVSSFGRLITVPSSTKKSWRKMRKYGRWIFAWLWFWLTFLLTRILANFVLSLFLSYAILLLSILFSLYRRQSSHGIWFWWSGGSWWGWSGFGWFGWGSFGWGWSSWSR